ncbi:NACHT domain-containing protein [Pseudomonas sp. 18173]|uniref:NACHT domain-containing protein n=1 Tax=Pseudomonas sp. 18173 TaxID=3390055 RepID=UPI003D1EC0CC
MFTEAAVAAFITKNFEKIISFAKGSYDTLDESVNIALRTAYTDYLTNTSQKYSKSKSFFLRDQPTNLYDYYVPIGIRCGRSQLPEPSLTNCLATSNRIIISGTGGSGKSVLMKHLFLDCIDSDDYAPVMLELRDLNEDDKDLDSFITDTLSSFDFKTTGLYIQKAKKSGHFCFFLDGFDEVDHSKRKKLLKEIKHLSNKYQSCPIFISSRPDESFEGLDDFTKFNIQPLDLPSASILVEKLPFDTEIKEKFIKELHSKLFKRHRSFLSNPLLLSIMLLTYGENAEIPTKLSIFYNQAYEALFRRHDSYKGGYTRSRLTTLDSQDFSRTFALFSLQSYEKREFKMSRSTCISYLDKCRKINGKDFTSENYLQDLLSAVCLLVDDGLEVAFSHRSFQEYFVALYISTEAPEIQSKLIKRYSPNIKSDKVISLLHEINPDLVERSLILPELEKLFSALKVKNKIGITHSAKYLKMTFSILNISQGKCSATGKNGVISNDIADLVATGLGGYVFPENEYFNQVDEERAQRYCSPGNESKSFHFSKLTYKSPILRDVIEGEGRFSLKYLQCVFLAYKKMKIKHSNRLETLDNLLGI